jgi:hypothetical protein
MTLQVAFTDEEQQDSDTTYMYVAFFLSFPPNSNNPCSSKSKSGRSYGCRTALPR